MAGEPDAQLRRIGRSAVVVVVCATGVALLSGAGVRGVLGVLAGGLIAAVSYRGIRAGVDVLVGRVIASTGTSPSGSGSWGLVKTVTRFTILSGIAYVMMVRLRAHPGWTLVGTSSIVVAAAVEAVRSLGRAHR